MAGAGRIEKHVLREAFEGALPEEILWRQKEQFSDGVGYGWIDSLKAHAEAAVSDAELASAATGSRSTRRRRRRPTSYRRMFAQHFPGEACAAHRAGRQVHRLLDADGDRLGRLVRGGRRSIRPRDRRSARRRAALAVGL